MVEGPGAANNAKKARILVGRKVIGLNGAAVATAAGGSGGARHHQAGSSRGQGYAAGGSAPGSGEAAGGGQAVSNANGAALKLASQARGRVLSDVLVLGKEVWLLFSSQGGDGDSMRGEGETEGAIRLHFGMSGSLHVISPKEKQGQPTKARARMFVLGLVFEGGAMLRTFESTVSSADASLARMKVLEGQHRDVCVGDSVFQTDTTTMHIATKAGTSLISDALLDQALLPG